MQNLNVLPIDASRAFVPLEQRSQQTAFKGQAIKFFGGVSGQVFRLKTVARESRQVMRMKKLAMLLVLMLTACTPSAFSGIRVVPFVSAFAGFFPQDPHDEVLPVWEGTLENLEPIVMSAIKLVDPESTNLVAVEITDQVPKGLKVHELRSAQISKNRLRIVVSATLEHVAVGVFDLAVAYPNIPSQESMGARFETVIGIALDARFARDQF